MLLRLTIPLLICTAVALAQNDGRYRPAPSRSDAGRSSSGNDGRYVGGNDGRYRGGNDGRYVHMDNKYEHDNRPGGAYAGGSDPYAGSRDRFGGAGGAGRGAGANGANGNGRAAAGAGAGAGSGAVVIKPRPTAAVARPPPTVDLRPNLPQGKGTGEGKGGFAIIRQDSAVQTDGYNYLYETENGILGEESGRIEKQTEGGAIRSQGYYEYTGDDGLLYRVDYVADENGFVPSGEHIPKVPEHIPRLLEYLKAQGAL